MSAAIAFLSGVVHIVGLLFIILLAIYTIGTFVVLAFAKIPKANESTDKFNKRKGKGQ